MTPSSNQRAIFVFGPFVRAVPRPPMTMAQYRRRLRAADVRVIEGDCLRPWFVDGDVLWFDRSGEPRDGDLVLTNMAYRRFSGLIGGDNDVIEREAIKQLRVIDGERFLTSADGWIHAEGHEILGAACAWYRPGWWRRPAVRHMDFPDPRDVGSGFRHVVRLGARATP